jgi:cell division protein FtsQ
MTDPLPETEPLPGEVRTPADAEEFDDGQAHFEGPRRKARREREERREAEARARAIEDARREAKRKVTAASTATKPVGRGTVRGLKLVIWGFVATLVTVGLGLVLYFTPLMSVRNFVIEGLQAVPQDEVVAAAAVPTGTPLLQVDTEKVADRVAAIRRVASVRVQREYPSTLRVVIVERIAVAVKDLSDGSHQFDRDGVDFATGPPPPGVPYLDVENPGPRDPPTRAALQVLVALHPDVTALVGRIAAPSVASITLTLKDGRVVVWGTTDRTEAKAETLAALLTQPGHTYDVSSPDLPTVK